MLNVLAASSSETFSRADFGQQLLSIKKSFVERDYQTVFSTPAHLPIYAAQYVSGRSLCYFDLFRTELFFLRFLLNRQRLRVTCLGGGSGSEVIALAGVRALLELHGGEAPKGRPPSTASTVPSSSGGSRQPSSLVPQASVTPSLSERLLEINVYDMGDWHDVLNHQVDAIRKQWCFHGGDRGGGDHADVGRASMEVASAMELASLSDNSTELHPDNGELRFRFVQTDIFALNNAEWLRQVARSDMVTLMFVVNELFVPSTRRQMMDLFERLIAQLRPGALLLVADSAGDFSHFEVGRHTFMIYTLLDALRGLKRLMADDARWYRVPEGLRYPLDVQNMRYFVRLYQREAEPTAGSGGNVQASAGPAKQ